MESSTKIIAHRGYHSKNSGIEENSLPGFERAFKIGADGIEFDVHLTKDNEFVVYHDFDLKKFNRKEKIENLTCNQLKKLQLDFEHSIPLLTEVLERYSNKFLLNIEVKSNFKGGKELAKLINSSNINLCSNNIIVSSFHHKPLMDIKLVNKEIPTGFLTVFSRMKSEKLKKKIQCDFIHLFYDLITVKKIPIFQSFSKKLINHYADNFIRRSRNYGLGINLWTVNSTEYLTKAFDLDIFGIITDYVERAQFIRNKSSSEKSEKFDR